ncbi:hypothetical protein SAMN05421538_102317 [Paracoccus isoporae]|uniref:Dienelactone hydrolase n=2 Tax=Paracoccus isoporae TaxID=591205 RepID=A0A1G6X6X5_9RHOB|nr:hypothetical protein SAMN05421538_102317 [Paracoccus isoporae]
MIFRLTLAILLITSPALAAAAPGYARIEDRSVSGRPLAMSIWYPAQQPQSASIGGNPVFKGSPAAVDAPIDAKDLPLVVMSHGGLRSAPGSGAWLAASIARAGYIFVELSAPRPESAAEALDEIWLRPQDLSRAIDRILSDDDWGLRVDPDRIAVAGVALGATAALTLAGAELDKAGYLRGCDGEGGKPGPDCDWLARQNVSLSDTSRDGLATIARDRRVDAVIAIGPEYAERLGDLPADIASLWVTLGESDTTSGAQNATISTVIAEASIVDSFAVCTPAGPEILAEEGEDGAICGSSPEARETIHRLVADEVIAFLKHFVD